MTDKAKNQPTEWVEMIRHPTKQTYNEPRFTLFGRVGELTHGGSFTPSSDGVTSMMGSSDRRLKENVCQVGRHPFGFGLYLFDYKPEYRDTCGHGRQFGVMADEVEAVRADAVSVHPDGYKMVNYAMLGIARSVH